MPIILILIGLVLVIYNYIALKKNLYRLKFMTMKKS